MPFLRIRVTLLSKMRITSHTTFLFGFLTIISIVISHDVQSQTGDTIKTISLPLPNEDFTLYAFAEIRFETEKTEVPPPGLVKRNFKPVKKLFSKDSLYFSHNVQNVWFKFTICNNLPTDTSVALVFQEQ